MVGFEGRLIRVAAVGMLAASLGLAGCGRKAGLDPPPQASAAAGPAADEPAAGETKRAKRDNPGPGFSRGKPVAPRKGEKTPFFLDWLVD